MSPAAQNGPKPLEPPTLEQSCDIIYGTTKDYRTARTCSLHSLFAEESNVSKGAYSCGNFHPHLLWRLFHIYRLYPSIPGHLHVLYCTSWPQGASHRIYPKSSKHLFLVSRRLPRAVPPASFFVLPSFLTYIPAANHFKIFPPRGGRKERIAEREPNPGVKRERDRNRKAMKSNLSAFAFALLHLLPLRPRPLSTFLPPSRALPFNLQSPSPSPSPSPAISDRDPFRRYGNYERIRLDRLYVRMYCGG